MRRLLFFCLLICLAPDLWADAQQISLKTALDKGLIQLEAKASAQGFHHKGLTLHLRNKTIQTLQIRVDPGLIFQPVDTHYQDLVLPGENIIVLSPKAELSTDLQSFCGKSYARAPGNLLAFRFRKQGDSSLIRVMQFINKYQLYNEAGQAAVWVLTNKHPLDGVYDPERPEISNKLVALLVSITGQPTPDCFRQYRINQNGGEPVFEKRVLKMFTVFEWDQPAEEALTLAIYNHSDEVIQPIEADKNFKRGHYKVTITFEAEQVPPGSYYIRVKNRTSVLQEKKVTVD